MMLGVLLGCYVRARYAAVTFFQF